MEYIDEKQVVDLISRIALWVIQNIELTPYGDRLLREIRDEADKQA